MRRFNFDLLLASIDFEAAKEIRGLPVHGEPPELADKLRSIEAEAPPRSGARIATSVRRLGPPKGNTSGSTRCLCGCGGMVSGSRKFKQGHG